MRHEEALVITNNLFRIKDIMIDKEVSISDLEKVSGLLADLAIQVKRKMVLHIEKNNKKEKARKIYETWTKEELIQDKINSITSKEFESL